MTEFTKEVIDIISSIPKGKVMTYGQVATWAGNPWGARQVVRILNSMSVSHKLPWHRIVGAKGNIRLPGVGGLKQIEMLSDEGVIVADGNVDLNIYLYEVS
jgi:methylated-DNA-protein-cysteine methyltransferase-like protein